VGAIAFGAAALLLASGFIERIFVDFRESSIHSRLGHVELTKPGYRQHGTADPYRYLIPSQPSLSERLGALPTVAAIAPRLYFSGLASHGDTTLSVLVEGVLPDKEVHLSDAMTISAGHRLDAEDTAGVIVGEGLAANLGVKPGDELVLLATTGAGGVNAVELTVRGLFFTVTKAYDDSAMRIQLSTAQRLLRVSGSHVWTVLLRDTADTPIALHQIEKIVGNNLDAVPWWDLADFYNKTVKLFSRQLDIVRLIVGAIIVLSITNTMFLTVVERTSEVGTLMAMGTKRREIVAMFLLEGLLLGLIGACVGLMLGSTIAAFATWIGIPMPAPPGMSHGFLGGVLVTRATLFDSLTLAIVTTTVASILPAVKAARMPVVDALRHSR